MQENKVSEAQVRASRAWEEKNKKKVRIDASRRQAKSFVRRYAVEEDIEELIEIYNTENENIKNKLKLIKK